MHYDYDYIVVGSGFGGSVAALRLTEKGYNVAVMEMGKRWTPDNLPRTNWQLSRWLWQPWLGWRGFFSLRLFRHAVILHGNAVGGGSITYASTLLVPDDAVWQQGSWAGLHNWQAIMPAHFTTATHMLGVTTNQRPGPADQALQQMAQQHGTPDSFYLTRVGIFFGNPADPPGTRYADPYFGGKGPERQSCIGCGGCMVGCRHNAKNTLDKNYLYLAEHLGMQLHAQTKVIDVTPLPGSPDGQAGYLVTTTRTGSRQHQQFRCKGVVLAASSLGTQELLLRLRQRGSLPALSPALGKYVRTNAESLIGIRYPGGKTDLSQGVAIGSGMHLNKQVHIEATRYPAGSDSMGLITTLLTLIPSDRFRRLAWVSNLLKHWLCHPYQALRLLNPHGFAKEAIIFLCMQALDQHLTMMLKRRWYWPFARTLASTGPAIPTNIPAANHFAITMAQHTGGIALTSKTEVLFNIPMTAHCLGGACMASTPDEGVCDGQGRVFGYANLLICDGSMISANLGVNPSLTITALAEHVMSHIPPAAHSHEGSNAS